jgi:hypothetical protein
MYSVIWSLRSLILCLLCMRSSVLLTSRCSLTLLLWHTYKFFICQESLLHLVCCC